MACALGALLFIFFLVFLAPTAVGFWTFQQVDFRERDTLLDGMVASPFGVGCEQGQNDASLDLVAVIVVGRFFSSWCSSAMTS